MIIIDPRRYLKKEKTLKSQSKSSPLKEAPDAMKGN